MGGRQFQFPEWPLLQISGASTGNYQLQIAFYLHQVALDRPQAMTELGLHESPS